ncbi:HNH endonuclease signature motif containing protein [Streptomyces sp. NPDC050856]|uniref:HNH endonuclease n=1 Tax=Streptomyces sp. NPDC050856 TaxID=3154939 RepID=UPI0034060D94
MLSPRESGGPHTTVRDRAARLTAGQAARKSAGPHNTVRSCGTARGCAGVFVGALGRGRLTAGRGGVESCIDCTEPTPIGAAARPTTPRTRTVRPSGSVRARGQRRAARNDAAARLRRVIERKGTAWCDWCLNDFPTVDVDVDHVRPLSMGGTDTDGNVQVLCRGCHQLKRRRSSGRPPSGRSVRRREVPAVSTVRRRPALRRNRPPQCG